MMDFMLKRWCISQVTELKAAKEVAICIQIDEFCIKNDEFCILNDELNTNAGPSGVGIRVGIGRPAGKTNRKIQRQQENEPK